MISKIKPIFNSVKSHGTLPINRMMGKAARSKGITWQTKHLDSHVTFINTANKEQKMTVKVNSHLMNGYVIGLIMDTDLPKKTLIVSNLFDDKGKALNKYQFYINDSDKINPIPSNEQKVLFIKDNLVVGIYDISVVQKWKERPTNDLLKILEGFNPFTL